jgi:hypothetical protein
MDILNFISWIRGRRQVTTVDANRTLIPLGLKDGRRDDEYLAGAITVQDFVNQYGTGPQGPIGPAGPQGVQGPIGAQGIPGPVGPAGLNWQGAWSASGTYVIDDAVGYNGASWFCINPVGPSVTTPDLDPTNWALLAAEGAQGPQGIPGVQGPTGAQGPSGGSHYIGELVGGGIVVALWKEGITEKALVASLTDLSTGIQWTLPAFQSTLIGPAAQSFSDGLGNTNAIIAQTTAPAASTYAAGLARLHAYGGYNDWYLPALWELNMCYNSAAIVNKVLGTESFTGNANYWSSTEHTGYVWYFNFYFGAAANGFKGTTFYVRAVRTHTF